MRIGKIVPSENIATTSSQPGSTSRGARKPFSLVGLGLRLRGYFDWHPLMGGICAAVFTAVLLASIAVLVAHVVPLVNGWPVCTPQNGVVLALLLLARRRLWPAILIGYVAALALGHRLSPSIEPHHALEVIGNLAEVVLVAFTLPPFRSLKQWLQEPRLLRAFVGYGVVLGPVLMSVAVAQAVAGQLRNLAAIHSTFWDRVGTVALAEALGLPLATLLVLILLNRETYFLFRKRLLPQTVVLLGVAAASTWFVFVSGAAEIELLVPLAILILLAFRLGLRAAVLGLSVSVTAAVVAVRFHSPNAQVEGPLQSFIAFAILSGMPLSLTIAKRHFLEERLGDANRELDRLKSLDRLTGVPNRKRFEMVLDREWQRATREPKHVALIMVDVDEFDHYTRHYGAQAGDECLRRVAARMSEQPHRAYDLISRLEGGKFSVLLPGASGEAVGRIAEAFRGEIAAQAWPHELSPFEQVTVSVGWASMVPTSHTQPASLIAGAESALRLARDNGQNRVEGFVAAMTEGPHLVRSAGEPEIYLRRE